MKKFTVVLFSVLFSVVHSQQTTGLLQKDEGLDEGYILFAPLLSHTTFLIDRCGRVINKWESRYRPGQSAYLLPDGSLLRCANDSNTAFASGGGRIERFDWKGKLLWSYAISTPTSCLHHDIWPMPNGNILAILWEKRTPEEMVEMGRDPSFLSKFIWLEKIIELKPSGADQAEIVWQWSIADHLVQDYDPGKSNYGKVGLSPQLLNLNYIGSNEEDWLHFNSVCYNPQLDQVLVSNRNLCEIFIIDHSTTTAEAASHRGGRYGRGGDILYRWGNAATYACAEKKDRKFFMQHSAHWIQPGLKDAGKIMVFNNGTQRPGEPYSTVEIIDPPMNDKGGYLIEEGKANKPEKATWTTEEVRHKLFYSHNVSNAQRMPNGNLLICEGASGRFFEIDPAGQTHWEYVSPVTYKGCVASDAKFPENPVFRCCFYPKKYSAFKGKKLKPGQPLELNPVSGTCK